MPLWVDKYRPKSLTELDYHKDQGLQLKKLVRFLIRGPTFDNAAAGSPWR